MGLIEHAKIELEMSGLFNEDTDFYGGETGKAVLELIETFSKQGHSGMSAQIVTDIFHKLSMFKPLGPITGKDEEWSDVSEAFGSKGVISYQNKRCSAIFKEGKEGKPYYLDAIVWQGEDSYDTFTGVVEGVKSSQYIRLPFQPKTFYIDVKRELYDKDKHGKDARVVGCQDGDYVYLIKDKNQLDEVAEYYDGLKRK